MRILLFVFWLLCLSLPVRATNFGDVPASTDVSTLWSSFAFKTIAVSGQSDVVADGTADTLTLAAGSNITITTDATTDTVTIAAAGASTSAHYVTTQAESGLSAEFSLGSLSSGILKQTVSVGVATPAIATEGSDYLDSTRISDTAYDATTWNGDTTHAPTKNAVRDEIESLISSSSGNISDTAFASSWNGVTTIAPSKNAVYDEIHLFDTADDGSIINAGTGFRIGGAAASGKILIGNGTNYVASTPTYPNAASTAGKVIVSDGTNFVTSTPTFPNASATSGKHIKSDGTNWVASTETYAAPGTSGNVLTSDGTNWTSAAAAGGQSFVVGAKGGNDDVNISSATYVTVVTKSVASIAANDTIAIDIDGVLLNNSGGSATYSFQLNVGAVAIFDTQGPNASFGNSSTSRVYHRIRYVISVSATNLWKATGGYMQDSASVAANTLRLTNYYGIYNTGTNDLTGTSTITFKIKSTAAAGTETFTVQSYVIAKIPQT